jgi:hypothetical protein
VAQEGSVAITTIVLVSLPNSIFFDQSNPSSLAITPFTLTEAIPLPLSFAVPEITMESIAITSLSTDESIVRSGVGIILFSIVLYRQLLIWLILNIRKDELSGNEWSCLEEK